VCRYCTRYAAGATADLAAKLIAGPFLSSMLAVGVETPTTVATLFIAARWRTGTPGRASTPIATLWASPLQTRDHGCSCLIDGYPTPAVS
jgi:hypothetical protein